GARRWAVAPCGNPPRERRGGAGDRAGRDSRASWGHRGPSGGCDGPGRAEDHNPGSGSRGLDGGAPAVAPEESSGSEYRPPPPGRPGRGASPPDWRRTPGAETFPRERAHRPRAPTGRARRRPPGPRHRHGPPPGSALPERRGRFRGGAPSLPAAPGRPLAAAPSSAVPRARPPDRWPRHPHVLAGRARGEPDAPRQPVRTRAEAVAPPAAGVELANQIEQAGGGGVEVGGELGDLVAESIQFLDRLGRGNDAERAGFHERVPLLLGRIYTPLSEAPWSRHNVRS